MSTERALNLREAENYEESSSVSIVETTSETTASETAYVSNAFRVAFAVLAEVLVGTGRIVRRVGPNERPEERYEFENPDHKNVRGPGYPLF